MGKSLMILGTASSVGKSLITTGLCRLFYRRGYRVTPFKSQNLSLNSYITADGGEMGRAQVVQAEASGREPDVRMNPILIKPGEKTQIIFSGKVVERKDAEEYKSFRPKLKMMLKEIYTSLEKESDLLFLEGAGSPAEINLREGDMVNMGMAEISDSPVVIVGDIERGGVFASIYGTVTLLSPEDRRRVKGFIINKFHGDPSLIQSGIEKLEQLLGIPSLGVLPWSDIHIEEEDTLTDTFPKNRNRGVIEIAVLKYPYISNFTDVTILDQLEDVSLRYVKPGESIGSADIIILPGSKSVIADLKVLKASSWDSEILELEKSGSTIIGICGGYQMLGQSIEDPYAIEGSDSHITGLGLLNIKTTISLKKRTRLSRGRISTNSNEWSCLNNLEVEGYELHMGVTESNEEGFITLEDGIDGVLKDSIIGTYFHGIFDNTLFTNALIEKIKGELGVRTPTIPLDYRQFKEDEYNRLADLLESNLDISRIETIIKSW